MACYNNPNLASLPELPSGLQRYWCSNTQILYISDLPPELQEVGIIDTPPLLEKQDRENDGKFILRCRAWKEEQAAAARAKERSSAIHEELVAAVWAPHRVEKWLETGGFEMIEAL